MWKKCKICDKTKDNENYYRLNLNTCKKCIIIKIKEKYREKHPLIMINCKYCNKDIIKKYPTQICCSKTECKLKRIRNYRLKHDLGQYYLRNKNNPSFRERRLKNQRIWAEKNKNKIKIYQKKTYYKNKKKYQKKVLEKLKEDDIFRFKFYLRNSIRDFFKKRKIQKENPTHEILGCSWKEFIKYIESNFKEDMNWNNYGGVRKNIDGTIRRCWEIDHSISMKTAKTKEEIIKLNHYSNLKPMWWWENVKKGG